MWLLFIHLLTQVGPCLYNPQHEVGRVRPAVNRRQIHLLLLPLQHVGSNLSLAELLHSFSVQQQHGGLLLRPLGLRFFQGPSNLRVSDTKAKIKAKTSIKGRATRASFTRLAWCCWLTGGGNKDYKRDVARLTSLNMFLSLSRCNILAFCSAFLSVRGERLPSAASAILFNMKWTGASEPNQQRFKLQFPNTSRSGSSKRVDEHREPPNSALCCGETDTR